jgi:hypothetical protein
MWFMFLACALSDTGPAPTGSPAADALVDVQRVEEQAIEVADLANQGPLVGGANAAYPFAASPPSIETERLLIKV